MTDGVAVDLTSRLPLRGRVAYVGGSEGPVESEAEALRDSLVGTGRSFSICLNPEEPPRFPVDLLWIGNGMDIAATWRALSRFVEIDGGLLAVGDPGADGPAVPVWSILEKGGRCWVPVLRRDGVVAFTSIGWMPFSPLVPPL